MTDTYFSAAEGTRRIRGLLLPFGELSSPSVSGTDPVMFSAGTVELPADPAIVTLNEEHDSLEPRARGVEFVETDAGIEAEFEVAKTPEGDALLARATDPDVSKRPRLSAELRGLVRKGKDAIAGSLRGAAVVNVGAFQSAALFSALGPVTEELDTETEEDLAERVAAAVVAAITPTEGATPEAEEKEEDMTAGIALVPDGLTPPAGNTKDVTTADGLFSALAEAGRGAREGLAPFAKNSDALFAIATVQESGPTGKTIYADTAVPSYIGELWTRRPFERRFVPLVNHATLTSTKVVGWRWTTEPTVADYSGNVAEIPSNAVDTEPVETSATRIAGGHKLDRKFIDFGDTAVYASYFSTMTENYARFTDGKALAAIVAAATATTPGAVPSGVPKGLAAVVDGALDVIATDNKPSFAVVSPELWRDTILLSKDDVLGYLSASLGLEGGDVEGFKLLPGNVGTGKVVVGAKEAMTIYELPGAPIRVEGIDPHHGAIDPALFGYWATLTHNAAAIRSVTVAPAA